MAADSTCTRQRSIRSIGERTTTADDGRWVTGIPRAAIIGHIARAYRNELKCMRRARIPCTNVGRGRRRHVAPRDRKARKKKWRECDFDILRGTTAGRGRLCRGVTFFGAFKLAVIASGIVSGAALIPGARLTIERSCTFHHVSSDKGALP